MSTPLKITCTQCGGTTFLTGYLGTSSSEDKGTYGRWYDGPLELGMLGDVKHAGSRAHFQVLAHRCEQCGHLEMFAGAQD
jgi:hypothetical protein